MPSCKTRSRCGPRVFKKRRCGAASWRATGTIFAEGGVEHREYPQGTLAAHVVGFSGALQDDGRYGLEGLELSQDATLERGDDVILTLDPNLQAVAQAKLQETIAAFGAENGAVVMLEAGSGRILAAASYPDFDPNSQGGVEDRDRIINKAFVRLFEPGSVMKPFVVASLLETGRLRLERTRRRAHDAAHRRQNLQRRRSTRPAAHALGRPEVLEQRRDAQPYQAV